MFGAEFLLENEYTIELLSGVNSNYPAVFKIVSGRRKKFAEEIVKNSSRYVVLNVLFVYSRLACEYSRLSFRER